MGERWQMARDVEYAQASPRKVGAQNKRAVADILALCGFRDAAHVRHAIAVVELAYLHQRILAQAIARGPADG